MESLLARLPLIISTLALLVAAAALGLVLRAGRTPPQLLVYDQANVDAEAKAYVAKGLDGVTIINQAFDAAKGRGHVILRASKDIAYPSEALFRVTDFIAAP